MSDKDEARRAILEKIGIANGLKSELEAEKAAMQEAFTGMHDEVSVPVAFPQYDLSEDRKWDGVNYDTANGMLNTIVDNIKGYEDIVMTNMTMIDKSVTRLAEIIDDLYAQLAALD